MVNQEKIETSSMSEDETKELRFGRKLGTTITRTVSTEADLKQAVVDANANTGNVYHVTIAITFSLVIIGLQILTALYFNGAKMSIFAGLSGSKVELRGQGQAGGYMMFDIRGNSVVHLEMPKITNGYAVNDFILFNYLTIFSWLYTLYIPFIYFISSSSHKINF